MTIEEMEKIIEQILAIQKQLQENQCILQERIMVLEEYQVKFAQNQLTIQENQIVLMSLHERPQRIIENPAPKNPESNSKVSETFPTVRQLQVGDLVQIRDQSSPYYLETLSLSKVGILRASVSTDIGEQNFLKRDLRFIPPPETA